MASSLSLRFEKIRKTYRRGDQDVAVLDGVNFEVPPGDFVAPAALDCNIVFAPQGTTTDGSGYTAIEVGLDGQVYVGSARYGDYVVYIPS